MNDLVTATYGNQIRIRSCGICMKDDALLLVKHEGLGSKNILWLPPGGGVKFGEPAAEALKREFLEETGLNISVGELLFVNEFIHPPLHAVELFFEVDIINGAIIAGTDPEMKAGDQIIKEVKFVTFEEIKLMDKETLHNTLHKVTNRASILNMSGYFKYSQ